MFFLNKNKILCYALTGMVALGNVVPSNAATLVNSTSSDFTSQTVGEDTTQGVTYTEQDEVTNKDTTFSDSYETEVYETKASEFSFVIPKTITLDGESNEGTYQVKVKGNITGNQTISITTPETFELAEQNATVVAGNKATATITSETDGGAKTVWNQSEIDRDDYTGSGVTEGIIHSDLVRAGSYKGAFDFTVELKDAPITKAAGAYDVDGNLICELTREEVETDYSDSSPLFKTKGLSSEERNKIVEVVIPEGTTKIGSYAFCDCKSLTTIDIPDSVTTIRYYAFSECTSLTAINIPDSVTSIGIDAFYNCCSLTAINIPDSVTSIGDRAFYYCTSLATVTYKDTTYTSISALTTALTNNGVSVGSGAFSYTKLQS